MPDKSLIYGTGYKSCWAFVEGSCQQQIKEALLGKDAKTCGYNDGLKQLRNTPYEKNPVIITADFEGTNYIIGDGLSQVFYDREAVLGKFRPLAKVYVYLTHRVSECHGFALLENGIVTRLYYIDEEQIQNIGEPLEEEKDSGYNLPKNFDEMWKHWKDGQITKVDEETIVELAIKQSGTDTEKYPYEDVVFGSLI